VIGDRVAASMRRVRPPAGRALGRASVSMLTALHPARAINGESIWQWRVDLGANAVKPRSVRQPVGKNRNHGS